MDKQFTEKIVAWLETPADERDYEQGSLYLLQLNNNQIMYRNVTRNLKKHAEFIEYQIRKYVKFRLASLTHEQVEEMQMAVEKIVAERHLDKEPSTEQSALTEEQQKVVEFTSFVGISIIIIVVKNRVQRYGILPNQSTDYSAHFDEIVSLAMY